MRKSLILLASAASLLALTEAASAALCGPSAGGALGGAAAGAATGAVVGGPPGAVVGGIIGGTAGAAIMPKTACTYVIQQPVPAVKFEGDIVVGKPLPEAVVLHPIPEYETYVFANVNDQRVLVDPRSRVVIEVIN